MRGAPRFSPPYFGYRFIVEIFPPLFSPPSLISFSARHALTPWTFRYAAPLRFFSMPRAATLTAAFSGLPPLYAMLCDIDALFVSRVFRRDTRLAAAFSCHVASFLSAIASPPRLLFMRAVSADACAADASPSSLFADAAVAAAAEAPLTPYLISLPLQIALPFIAAAAIFRRAGAYVFAAVSREHADILPQRFYDSC